MNKEQAIEYIKKEFIKIDKIITDRQAEQFYLYYELLVEKNKVMNLTAITEFDEVVLKHFIDSCLFSSQYIDGDGTGKSLIDVGTGAGFPGLPLKILYPGLKVTLLDSLNKRINFLQEVIGALGLTGIDTIHYRAEDGARDIKLREQFDFAVSRAVANLSVLTEYCVPYVRQGGYFVAFKSGTAEEELANAKRAIFLLGGREEQCINGNLPETDIARTLIFIYKKDCTSKKYPRKAGMPTKQPL